MQPFAPRAWQPLLVMGSGASAMVRACPALSLCRTVAAEAAEAAREMRSHAAFKGGSRYGRR